MTRPNLGDGGIASSLSGCVGLIIMAAIVWVVLVMVMAIF